MNLSEEDIERIAEKVGGASISMRDPRVNQAQNWIMGLVGTGIVVSLGWLANSVDSLNRNFAALSEWRVSVDRRLDQLDRKP